MEDYMYLILDENNEFQGVLRKGITFVDLNKNKVNSNLVILFNDKDLLEKHILFKDFLSEKQNLKFIEDLINETKKYRSNNGFYIKVNWINKSFPDALTNSLNNPKFIETIKKVTLDTIGELEEYIMEIDDFLFYGILTNGEYYEELLFESESKLDDFFDIDYDNFSIENLDLKLYFDFILSCSIFVNQIVSEINRLNIRNREILISLLERFE